MSAQITARIMPPASYGVAGSYKDWLRVNREPLWTRWTWGINFGTDEYYKAEKAYDDHYDGLTTDFTYYAETQFDLYMDGLEDQPTWDEAVGPIEAHGVRA